MAKLTRRQLWGKAHSLRKAYAEGKLSKVDIKIIEDEIPGWEWIREEFLPFNEARKFARSLRLSNSEQWREYCNSGNRPANIPSNPQKEYLHKGWVNLGDWLGTGYVATKERRYLVYEEARSFVKTLDIRDSIHWITYAKSGKKPNNIPATPDFVYRDNGWISWPHFLDNEYWDWGRCVDVVHKLKLKTRREWKNTDKTRLPKNIPPNPQRHFADIWEEKGGWSGWIGTYVKTQRRGLTLRQLKSECKKYKVQNESDYKGKKRDGTLAHLPWNPREILGDEFPGWHVVLDKPELEQQPCLSFCKAVKIAQKVSKKEDITSQTKWEKAYGKGLIPHNLPKYPRQYYGSNFTSFSHWVGKEDNRWTKQDDSKLIRLYKKEHSQGEIAKLMNRSVASVENRKRRLGLTILRRSS
tara:strand:+ start:1517 stop:2749 length:1233 start_codon:yes stop_codon:yes gene_type:complete